MTFERNLNKSKEQATQLSNKRVFQTQQTAGAKAETSVAGVEGAKRRVKEYVER